MCETIVNKNHSHKIDAMLLGNARGTIKLHEDAYTWRDIESSKVIGDGLTILDFVLSGNPPKRQH